MIDNSVMGRAVRVRPPAVSGDRAPLARSPAPGRRALLLRIMAVVLLAGTIVAFFATGADRLLSLDALRANEQWLTAGVARHPLLIAGGFFVTYVMVAGLAVPGALPLTVAAGAIFGVAEGTALVSFASSLGAVLSLLAARFLFRDFVARKFARRLEPIRGGLERSGDFHLLSLRLVPVVPFALVNVLFGVTDVSAFRFYWISQLGMLPATLLYVNAGTRLEHLRGFSGILSPTVLVSLLLLAILPLATRAGLAWLARRPRAATARTTAH
ncbi:MAG: TVP38/TMEM64 family protein [Rhodospirillales bacterium]|nr:TVP38/TMEM64 family protein [Rhodospirillales bacterium]